MQKLASGSLPLILWTLIRPPIATCQAVEGSSSVVGKVHLPSGIMAEYEYHFNRNALKDSRRTGDALIALTASGDLLRFDPGRFPRRGFMADGVLRLAYAGALTPTYELDVAIEAMALIRKTRPDLAVALDVYGRGDARTAWVSRAEALGLRHKE